MITMKEKGLLLIFLMVIAFVGCNNESEPTITGFEYGSPFSLAFGASDQSSDGQVEATFTKVVSDSRCPLNVVCVWEGEVTVELDVKAGAVVETITLSDHPNIGPRDTINNYIFILLDVQPYPESTEELDMEDYTIELQVEEL